MLSIVYCFTINMKTINKASRTLPMLLQWFFTAAEVLLVVSMIGLTALLFAAQSLMESKTDSSSSVTVRLDAAALELDLPEDAYSLTSETFAGDKFRIDNLQESIEVVNPENAEPFLQEIRAPLALFFLFVGAVGGGICEFFRRLFKNVREGRSFEPANISNLHKIGILIVLLEIGSSCLMGWSHGRAINFVREHVQMEGISMVGPARYGELMYFRMFVDGYPLQINLAVIVGGLMVLALGEAFRQGWALQEDNELTI